MVEFLNNRCIIMVYGLDAVNFLQSIVTNDVVKNINSYNYLLTPQGKYVYDFFISKISNEKLLIDVDSKYSNDLISKLNLYKLRKNVSIADRSSDYKLLYSNHQFKNSDVIIAYKDPRFEKLGFRAIISKTTLENFSTQKLVYVRSKYQFAIPDGTDDLVQERSIPLHFGAEELNGISFDKGCYIGQEVISRAKYQGVIRQKIYQIIADVEISFSHGTEIVDLKGEKIGILCSTFNNVGIGLLNEEKYLGLIEKIGIINDMIKVKIEIPKWRLVN